MTFVILIDPPGITKGFNTGLAYISALLKEKKIKHQILDFNNKSGTIKERLNAVKEAEWVGISIKTATLVKSLKLAKLIKQINPKVKLTAGGVHISIDGLNFMKDNSLFDYAFSGESEKNFVKLVDGVNFKKISNLYYRSEKGIGFTKKESFLQKLDNLPFPNFENFDSISGNLNFYPLTTSRGCPFQCIYCSVPNIIGKKWRARDPKQLIKELKLAKEKYSIKGFEILDDNFTLNTKRAKEFCNLLLKEKLNLKWCCSNGLRADSLNEELVKLMKETGCFSISLGIESGHPEVFKAVNKGEKIDQIVQAINFLKKYKIETFGYFIIGLPKSSFRRDMASVKFCKKIGIRGAFNILAPYPSTALWELISNNEDYKFLKDWKKGLHFSTELNVVFETKNYSAKQRIKAYHRANLRSSSYGSFFDKDKNLLMNFLVLLKKIIIYDPLMLPYHLISLTKVYFNYLKKFNQIS